MSTLDVVGQEGGKPANFLDAGGGSKADAIVSAVEVILSDPKVEAVLFNIFGGITRCGGGARRLRGAVHIPQPQGPLVARRHGPEDAEGRPVPAPARPANA